MSCFTTVTAVTAGADLDFTKHVNYTAGMILGVDDFTQEFAYLSGRDRWLARDAVGYGTISGLSVRIEKDGEKGFRVIIAPGTAINPRGQLICVPTAQCAYLNQWLAAADPKKLDEYIKEKSSGSPPLSPPTGDAELSLYVVLCYRDCPTDNVPIPGEPCRDESELTAPSRIKDDFSLELRFESPKHAEEEAVKNFAAWLRQIEIVETDASTDLDDFVKAIREKWLSPVTSPPEITSPPIELRINKTDVGEYLKTAFRIWVTEIRNVLSERKTGCSIEMSGGAKLENCVLLGEIKISLEAVSPGWKVSDTETPAVIEDKRPYLVHLRMLQEWLLGGDLCCAGTPITSPPITSPHITSPPIVSPHITSPPIVSPHITSPPGIPPHIHKLDDLSDVSLPSRIDSGKVLTFLRGKWTAADPPTGGTGVTDHGALTGLGDDDHAKYLLADGTRALTGDLNGGGKRITNLAAANANGQAVIFQQAIKQNDAAGGDLSGSYPNPSVARLQGKNVSNQTPNPNDVLTWNGTSWIPKQVETAEPKPFLILPLATVKRRTIVEDDRNKIIYEIWMNLDAPGNLAELLVLNEENLQILYETENPTKYLDEIKFKVPRKIFRNVFILELILEGEQEEPSFMRFMFNMNKEVVSYKESTMSLNDYATETGTKFSGYMEGEYATVFVRGADKIVINDRNLREDKPVRGTKITKENINKEVTKIRER